MPLWWDGIHRNVRYVGKADLPPQLIKLKTMTKDGKIMTCIVGQTVRNIVAQANELEIPREDIISMFALGGQIYLVFYK